MPSTREARIVDRFARHLSRVTLKEALQACGTHLVPQRSHRGYRSHPKRTLAPSPDRCSEYRQDSPPVPVSFAFSSFQNPAKMLRQNMPSRPLKSGENLRDSSCGASLGAVLEGLPSKFTETVGLLTNEVMSEAMGTVCKRLRGIYDVSDNLTKSLLKECLTSAENLPNAASPGNIPQRHLRPLTVDTGDRDMQPQEDLLYAL
ncbi:unnamed protein product [Dibothriocephalus latus]|uniref:Uncharacterized protein n=1 Tax=Dibothriocephalus latus TaxID=60516 RepID=A0A3P7P0F1_DIBLA|nr:unnamed protein product [Dibothriocephalus latus]